MSNRRIMNKFFQLVLTLFLLLGFSESIAQGVSTEGKDFWFGFMNNWLQDPNNPVILEVYISADDTTSGVLTVPKNSSFSPIEFEVFPGITTRIPLSSDVLMAQGTNSIENKGIHIETEKDVSVYAMNKRQYSADVAVVLPTFSLGSDYYVMAHWENGNRNNNDNSDSEFLIVGIADGTEIEIIPSVTTEGGNSAGEPFTIVLDQGEVFEVQARGDLTGTRVSAVDGSGDCQNFALFAGNQYTKVGQCNHPDGHDHLFAQQYPTNTWGKEFITVNYEPRDGGDLIKVLASKDNTTVQVNSTDHFLNAGEHIELTLAGVNTFSSNQPVAVGQFSRSQGCDNTRGDPFFILISPNEQLLEKITFNSPTIATVTKYSLNIIAKTNELSDLTLDGTNIADKFNIVPGNPEFSYAAIQTSSGNHTVKSEGGFICYVYGYGANESFGYSAGANLENLNIDVLITNGNGNEIPSDSICLNDVVIFKPITDTLQNHFEWVFGDGKTEVTSSRDSVVYQFDKTGTYYFSVTASIGGGGCAAGNEETFSQVLRVVNPKNKILGPRSICPNTGNVSYFLQHEYPYNYEWFVEGGVISASYGDNIVVDWGETNANASVKLLASNHFNCYGDTVTLPVRINIQLEPEAPFGADTLCQSSMDSIDYSTYFTEGSSYTWGIENGEINSGQGTHEVNVDWLDHGIGKLWFEQNTTTDTICAGISDTLFVFIQRAPSTIAAITTEKTVYQRGAEIVFNPDTDELYQMSKWSFGDGTNADSIPISSQSHSFLCSGVYEVSLHVYDTIGICPEKANATKEIEVLPIGLKTIQVSTLTENDSIIELIWETTNADFIEENISIYRKKKETQFSSLVFKASAESGSTHFTDPGVETSDFSYEYVLREQDDCQSEIETIPHQSILLNASNDDNQRAYLSWNEYVNWENGVETYQLFLAIDDGEFQLINQGSISSYEFYNDSLGFDYCFRIKALESGGNKAFSWSNISCAHFIPPIHTYNVITPNQDGKNDVFIIEGIKHYPNSVLKIINRWGEKVFETTGYKNNWGGTEHGKPVASGVYYYSLDLRDDRAETRKINGIISVLYGGDQ